MLRVLLTALALAALAACDSAAGDPSGTIEGKRGPELKRFASAGAFDAYVETLRRKARKEKLETFNVQEEPPLMADSAPAPPGIEAAGQAGAAQGTANPAITNNQTVGVDEGGIVKQVGRYLVMLQDGRLFSADLGAAAGAPLRLADRTDVYRSQATAADWYDEMLVLDDRILVTAYNYRERASEITVFRIDSSGRFTREGRFLLSSDDYYSTENYATRLVGDQLVFYAPLALDHYGEGGFQWPRLRRADGDGEADQGEALIGPTDVYAPPGEPDWPVIHTVSVCPLNKEMDCRTTAFVGPAMREFYVSPTDAFLWMGAPDGLPWSIDYANRRRKACPTRPDWANEDGAALLYRIPLDGGAIGAVAAEGVPADQFAFDSRDGRFRALLAKPDGPCTAGRPEELVLLDLPLSAFDRRIGHVAAGAYAPLPAIEGGELENRFVGDWLVYGGRADWSGLPPEPREAKRSSSLFAIPLARPAGAIRLTLPHNALRIERTGSDAVVTGYGGSDGLSLSYVRLNGARPSLAATTLLPHRVESEGRSHAFNAWIRSDGSGLIGLPTSRRVDRGLRGWSDSESSDLSFIAVSPAKALSPAGELGVRGRKPASGYDCQVSCVDWYGNSRPVFTGGRIFALLGTELVEGRMDGRRVRELARLDLTGRPAAERS